MSSIIYTLMFLSINTSACVIFTHVVYSLYQLHMLTLWWMKNEVLKQINNKDDIYVDWKI